MREHLAELQTVPYARRKSCSREPSMGASKGSTHGTRMSRLEIPKLFFFRSLKLLLLKSPLSGESSSLKATFLPNSLCCFRFVQVYPWWLFMTFII